MFQKRSAALTAVLVAAAVAAAAPLTALAQEPLTEQYNLAQWQSLPFIPGRVDYEEDAGMLALSNDPPPSRPTPFRRAQSA
jgi:hypothetical protein